MASNSVSQPFGFSSSQFTTAKFEKIWNIWIDVENWSKWDSGLKSAIHSGKLHKNSEGKVVPDKGPKARFKIVEWQEGKTYTMKTIIPFGGLFVKRTLSEKNGKTEFTHEVWFTGILKKFFFKKLGIRYQKMLPEVLMKIKSIAEESQDG